jgi:hypothetical protein
MILTNLQRFLWVCLITWIVLASLMLLFRSAHAAGESCLSIRNYDLRQACLAEQRQAPDDCSTIRNSDNREVCRLRAGHRDTFSNPPAFDRSPLPLR